MIGIRRHHEGPRLNSEQVVFPHEPRHPFVVHPQAAPPEFGRNPPIAIPTPMDQRDLLNLGPHHHLFLHGLDLVQRPVETGPADRHQLTHALDTQTAWL